MLKSKKLRKVYKSMAKSIRPKQRLLDTHPISSIQRFCMAKLGYNSCIVKEYDKITNKKEIARIAQITIDSLCDHTRKTIMENIEEATNDVGVIQFFATKDITCM